MSRMGGGSGGRTPFALELELELNTGTFRTPGAHITVERLLMLSIDNASRHRLPRVGDRNLA